MNPTNAWSATILLLVGAVGCASRPSESDDLAQALARTESFWAEDRAAGFARLGELWDDAEPVRSHGFSDTAIEPTVDKARREELSDDQVDRIAQAIQRGLVDGNSRVRKAAAIALCAAPRPRAETTAAIAVGLNSTDSVVTGYAARGAGRNLPPIESVLRSLLAKVVSDEFQDYAPAVDVLRAYGASATPHADPIAAAILRSRRNRSSKMYLLCDLELSDLAAKRLADLAPDFSSEELGIAAVCLLEHPALLKQVADKRPDTIAALQKHSRRLYEFLCRHPSDAREIRAWLAASDKLLPVSMGLLRDQRFLKRLAAAEESATDHERARLAACRRACGGEPGEQILVDREHPVEFRPRSAWPNVDSRRIDASSEGHGDGVTLAMFTGEVRDSDGSPPPSIAFVRLNDLALQGTPRSESEPVLYDASTGRFVYCTSIFAAYSLVEAQANMGPYQTGSAQVRLEVPGHQPLSLRFFDEMPDMRITVSR